MFEILQIILLLWIALSVSALAYKLRLLLDYLKHDSDRAVSGQKQKKVKGKVYDAEALWNVHDDVIKL